PWLLVSPLQRSPPGGRPASIPWRRFDMVDTLLSLKGVRKQYGEVVVTEVLRGIDLTISKGEFTAIMGASGSGKSTLLNQIGLLDRPSSGTIELLGQRIEH